LGSNLDPLLSQFISTNLLPVRLPFSFAERPTITLDYSQDVLLEKPRERVYLIVDDLFIPIVRDSGTFFRKDVLVDNKRIVTLLLSVALYRG
jgi:hypothetical protein